MTRDPSQSRPLVVFECVVSWRDHRGRHLGVVSLVLGGRLVVWSAICAALLDCGLGHGHLVSRPLKFGELTRLFG